MPIRLDLSNVAPVLILSRLKMKLNREQRKGYLEAVKVLRGICRKSFDWHLKMFGEDGAGPDDYADYLVRRLRPEDLKSDYLRESGGA